MDDKGKHITIRDAIEYFKSTYQIEFSYTTILHWMKSGKLKAIRFGRRYRTTINWIEEFKQDAAERDKPSGRTPDQRRRDSEKARKRLEELDAR